MNMNQLVYQAIHEDAQLINCTSCNGMGSVDGDMYTNDAGEKFVNQDACDTCKGSGRLWSFQETLPAKFAVESKLGRMMINAGHAGSAFCQISLCMSLIFMVLSRSVLFQGIFIASLLTLAVFGILSFAIYLVCEYVYDRQENTVTNERTVPARATDYQELNDPKCITQTG